MKESKIEFDTERTEEVKERLSLSMSLAKNTGCKTSGIVDRKGGTPTQADKTNNVDALLVEAKGSWKKLTARLRRGKD